VSDRSYRLETFGGLRLVGRDSRDISQLRRRLARLALLAAAGERGMSRDRLAAFLWPERDAEASRHSLEQLIHATRRALGEAAFIGTNPVSLNREIIASDVDEFTSAIERRDFSHAASVYRGPFLSGFYLDSAPEFERWSESERSRLAAQQMGGLEWLADHAQAAGDFVSAVRWRRQLVEADPTNGRLALAYMRALAASGDRSAALQHSRIHESLVRQELDTDPDATVATYAAALRAGTAEVHDHREPEPPLPKVPRARLPETDGRAVAGGQSRVAPRVLLAIAGGVIMMILTVGAWRLWRRERFPEVDPNTIVVVPFSITGGDSSVQYLREGVVDLLASRLNGEGGPRAVDPRTAISTWNHAIGSREGTADDARRVAKLRGAGQALLGSLVVAPSGLTLSAHIVRSDDGSVRPLGAVSAPRDSLTALLDRFVVQLLGREAGVHDQTLAALTSQSLPAIRAYLDGRAAYRRSRSAEAVRDFTRAIDIDSTFALASLDLATATTKLVRQQRVCVNLRCRSASVVPGFRDTGPQSDDAQFDRAIRLAWESRGKLGSRDRPLLAALRGAHWPRVSTARETLADLETAAAAAPDRADTQYLVGLLLLYQGTAIGYSDALPRAEAKFHLALKLDSVYLAPLARLVDVAAYDRNESKLRRYGTLYLARDSLGEVADYVRWRVAVGLSDETAIRQIRARFDSLALVTLKQIVTASQMSGVAVDDGERAAALIIKRTTDPELGLYWGHMLALNRGRPRQADSLWRLRHEIDSAEFLFRQVATWDALFGQGDVGQAESGARARAVWLERDTIRKSTTARTAPGPKTAHLTRRDDDQEGRNEIFQEAMWDWAHGRMNAASNLVAWSRVHGDSARADVGDMLIATYTGRSDAAALRARIDSAARSGCCLNPHHIDLLLAMAYERAGADTDALRAVRRGQWRIPTMYLSTYLRMEGRLAAKVGERARAIRAYEHYLALRSDPETPLRAERDSVRAAVDSLKRVRQ
jgi:DNA-binding SARP family transcriptional activator